MIFPLARDKLCNIMKSLNNLIYLKQVCKDCHSAILFCDSLNDKQIILGAVLQNFKTFAYIPESYKRDFDFALDCAKISPQIIKYVNSSLAFDKEWQTRAIKNNRECFYWLAMVCPDIAKDKATCYLACDLLTNIDAFDKTLFGDYNFLSNIISKNCFALEKILNLCSLSPDQVANLCLIAIASSEATFNIIPNYLKRDARFVQRAIFTNVKVKNYLK